MIDIPLLKVATGMAKEKREEIIDLEHLETGHAAIVPHKAGHIAAFESGSPRNLIAA